MKTELKNKIAAEVEAANFFDELPNELCGFTLKKIFDEDDDKFIYFAYENFQTHRVLTAYFHEETKEYKARVKIGLNEFCLTKFFTQNFNQFGEMITSELETTLKNFSENPNEKNPLIKEKNFSAWEYGKNLPKNIAGFELFITPENPVELTSGDCVIINYSDFSAQSDFTLVYNTYLENFSVEMKINRVSQVNYLFDSENLNDLEKKLAKNLSAELERMRKEIS